MNIPIYNCKIDENVEDATGIFAISFVDCPANETDFITLNKQHKICLNKNQQKQILTGVVLIPDQLIYRNSPVTGEYYIKFSSKDIEIVSQKMMKTGLALQHTTHQHEKPLKGNYLTELWIVEDPENDKCNALGFKNLPKGTLMCSYKIEDSEYWKNEVMTGNVKGFSLEGFFEQEINLSKTIIKNKSRMKKQKFVFTPLQKAIMLASGIKKQMLNEIESIQSDDQTGSGADAKIFSLEDGNEAIVDSERNATVNGDKMPAGKHKLADGNILLIGEDGEYLGTEQPSGDTNNPDEETAPENLRKRSRKQVRMEEETQPSTQDLQSKIAEMQKTIDDLLSKLDSTKNKLEKTKEELTELKKVKPSASPAMQKLSQKNIENITTSERMAIVLSQSIKNKRK